MSNDYEEPVEALSDGLGIEERKAVANAVTAIVSEKNNSLGESSLEQEFIETPQENYKIEEVKIDRDGENVGYTLVRESTGGMYILEETMDGNDFESDVTVTGDAIYDDAIEDKSDFDDFLDSLEDKEEIQYESKLEGYAAGGAL